LPPRTSQTLSEKHSASGYNWFCKCNVRLLRVARSTISATPTQARPAAPTIDDFRVTVAGSESDLAAAGTASASTTNPGSPASNVIDGNLTTRWLSLSGNVTGWWADNLPGTQIIRKMRFWHPAGFANFFPKDFTLERKDGAVWNVMQTITNYTWLQNSWNDFYFPNETTSTDYRINITLNHGSGSFVGLHECEMYNGLKSDSVIIYPEDDFEPVAPAYDLILHIAQAATAARQTQYPGFLEVLAIQSPDRTYSLFQTELEAIAGIIQTERTWFARLYRQTAEGIRSAEDTDFTVTV